MHAIWISFYKQELSIIALASKFSGYAPVVQMSIRLCSVGTHKGTYMAYVQLVAFVYMHDNSACHMQNINFHMHAYNDSYIYIVFCVGGSKGKSVLYFP